MKESSIILLLTAVLSAVGQVRILPRDRYTSTLNGTAIFMCLPFPMGDPITNVQWLVNGTELEQLDLPNIVPEFDNAGRGFGTLTISTIPEFYNRTQFQCKTTTTSDVHISSDTILLLIQGLLHPVRNLTLSVQESLFILTWQPPFSLNLTGLQDIKGYCVEVSAGVIFTTATLGVLSQCENETGFQYPLDAYDGCYLYILSVTALNSVGNGTQRVDVYRGTEADNIVGFSVSRRETDIFTYSLSMSAPVCTAVLIFVDLYTEDESTLRETDVHISGNDIIFTSKQVVFNRRYRVSVKAVNAAGIATSSDEIGTHDIQTATATMNPISERIEVTTTYSKCSNARGALFSFLFITDHGSEEVDFNRSFLLALDRNTSYSHTLPYDLYPGHYRVNVYDIEHDGTLNNGVGYPAATDDFMKIGPGQILMLTEPEIDDCQITTDVYVIRVWCTVSDNLQVIVQSIADHNVLHVNRSVSHRTPVTVPVERDGEYLVSIVAIMNGTGILGSTVQHVKLVMVNGETTDTTATIIGPVVALLGIVILVVVCVVIYCCRKRKPQDSMNLIDMTPIDEKKSEDPLEHLLPVSKASLMNTYSIDGFEDTGNTLDYGEYTALNLSKGGKFYAGHKLNCREGKYDPIVFGVKKQHLKVELNHRNIVEFIGVFDDDPIILVMEGMETSLDVLLKKKIQFPDTHVLYDVSMGLFYLHQIRLVHGNLASYNVLVNNNSLGSVRAKITDTRIDKTPITWVHYMPPEAQGKEPEYSTALDVFSFGHLAMCTMNHDLEVFLPPTSELVKTSELDRRINYINRLENGRTDRTLILLIKNCLSDNKGERPSAKKIMMELRAELRKEENREVNDEEETIATSVL